MSDTFSPSSITSVAATSAVDSRNDSRSGCSDATFMSSARFSMRPSASMARPPPRAISASSSVLVAGPLQEGPDQAVGRAGRELSGPQLGEKGEEAPHPRQGLSRGARLLGVLERADEPDAALVPEGEETRQGRVADAPPGRVDDAPERHLVAGVGHRTQVGEHVADLAAVEEPGPADDGVGDAAIGERGLEGAALGVGPVEDRHLAVADALVAVQSRDLARHEGGLVPVVARPVAPDPVTWAEGAPELLLLAEQVVADDGVGGVEDRLAGAVVLVEHDQAGVGEGPLELEQVAHLGPPEAVDALVGVADDADVATRLAELDHELVLGDVGVLVLVDEDLLEAVLVVLEHVGMLAEHAHGADEEVVEVHRVRGHEAPLVLGVGLGDAALVDGPGARLRTRRRRPGRTWPS